MPTFQEVLTDAQKYPDTLEIPIAEGFKITLKDLRESQALARAAEAAAKKSQETADAEALRAANALAEVQRQQAAAARQEPVKAADGAITWEQITSDPLLGVLAKRIDAMNAYGQKLEAIEKSLNAASARYLRRELESDFSAIPDRFDDVDMRQVIRHAVDNRLLDADGLPRVRAAYDDLTRERQIKRREDQAFERGKAEARNLAATEGMAIRPGFAGRTQAPEGAKVYTDQTGRASLDAAFEQGVHKDGDLMRQLAESLAAGAIQ